MNIIVPLLATVFSISAFAAEVTVSAIQLGTYELVLTNSSAMSESDARAQIAKAASAICKDAAFVLGKWRFASNELVAGAAASSSSSSPRAPDSFRFVQELTCVPGAQPSMGQRLPILRSEAEAKQAQSEIQLKSETYFKLIASKQVDEAARYVAMAGMGMNESRWKSSKLSFQSIAGEPVQISIAKITVYDNPPSAPAPGLYIAADYSNVYRDMPVHCGYLMWFRPVGGEFQITREETGYITSEQLKSIPNAQLAEVKRKLQCRAL